MKTAILLTALLAGPAFAACDLPAGWGKPLPHRAATSATMRYALKPGDAVRLTLSPAKAVRLAARSEHEAQPGRYAGLAALDVPRAGRLTISLSTATHVDVIEGGALLRSVAYARTADCPTMHKTVTFAVKPGRHVIQLIDAPERVVVMQAILG